jgi:DNA-binding GntR family transcriptional regulator
MTDKSQPSKAYEAIKKTILSQKLRPGFPIIETDFAKKLKMSRTPIREAIRHLSADGLVDIIPRKGAFIRSFGIEDLFTCYETAEALEGMAVYLVATRYSRGKIDKKKLNELNQFALQMEMSLEKNDGAKWASTDDKFHSTLYSMCGNANIVEFLDKIHDQLNCAVWFMSPYVDKKQSNIEHREIVEAIAVGDGERARTVMQRQFSRVRNQLKEIRPLNAME